MRGLDYRWLEALDSVIANGGFDKAAEALFVTQSAVSQRIKQLEKWASQPLLVRETPPRPTEAGQKLLGLYRRVCLLEQEMLPEVTPSVESRRLSATIGTNADSLATWLIPALAPVMKTYPVEFNFLVDNESRTLNRLRNGEAIAVISTAETSLQGCVSHYLGELIYCCVATPEFAQKYFPQGATRDEVQHAPTTVFDQFDDMQGEFLMDHFDLPITAVPKHIVRTTEAILELVKHGVANSLVPVIMIERELASGELVDVMPGKTVHYKLYWHHWATESGILSKISESCINYARGHLANFTGKS
ncbi:LysR family transcriptional regulator ArgP [Parasalinivibrio latis]|uniref:LysR family transcriptional regulator ArgP n=1 Tax=Parasalinivibrio latis TaxID=2952610 RepID=UPI0030DE0033